MPSNRVIKVSQVTAGEIQLKKYGKFMEEYTAQLDNIINSETRRKEPREHKLAPVHINIGELCEATPAKKPIELIGLCTELVSSEHLSIFQLIESDNKNLNKLLATFSQLCGLVDGLHQDIKIAIQKLMYYDEELAAVMKTEDMEDNKQQSHQSTQKIYLKLSNSLGFLIYNQSLARGCLLLGKEILQQMCALFTPDRYTNGIVNVQIDIIIEHIADLLHCMVMYDDILFTSNYRKYWPSFVKTIRSLKKNRSCEPMDLFIEVQLNSIGRLLTDLEDHFFRANYFETFLEDIFKLKQDVPPKTIKILAGLFQAYIKHNLKTLLDKFTRNLCENKEMSKIIKMTMMCITYHNFFGHLDEKLFQSIVDLNLKHSGISIISNVVWKPELFFERYVETLIKGEKGSAKRKKFFDEFQRFRKLNLQNKNQNLIKQTRNYCQQIFYWSLKLNSAMKTNNSDLKLEEINYYCALILQGIQFSEQLTHIIKSTIDLHVQIRTAIPKNILLCICKLMGYIKLIELAYMRNFEIISKATQDIVQYLKYKSLYILSETKEKLSSHHLYEERNLEIISALQITERCIYGPSTKQRLLLARMTINFAGFTLAGSTTDDTDDHRKLEEIFCQLDRIINLYASLKNTMAAKECLYQHPSILSTYLRTIKDNCEDFHYIINAACKDFMRYCEKQEIENFSAIQNYRSGILKQFKNEIAEAMCAKIENYLRLEVHSHLRQKEEDNAFVDSCRQLMLPSKIFEIDGKYVSLNRYVENYLSKMFYNMTAIKLSDRKSYSKMRKLAKDKFSLTTVEDQLPPQTLDQGIDVLEIMRNIHIFVARYVYNLNMQVFIESSSDSKYLNTLSIKQVANSLRTHGLGIINTTVNFIYQFLRKKFRTFSDFLCDEHIRSRLMRDLKYFRDNYDNLNGMYSYERADNLNRGIRQLGVSPQGQSCLDLFRQLISHIGNAMGYIRILKAGAGRVINDARVYLPRFDDLRFAQRCKEQLFSDETVEAASLVEESVQNSSTNRYNRIDYFRLLTDAFLPFFQNEENLHLRQFYLMIPALTINFVEHMISCRDRMNKKDYKDVVVFTDDGFAIGVAFILSLLNQQSDFNSLDWFRSIQTKFAKELLLAKGKQGKSGTENGSMINAKDDNSSIISSFGMKLTSAIPIVAGSRNDEKLLQTLALTQKRIKAYEMEFQLLFYNVSSCKILFQ